MNGQAWSPQDVAFLRKTYPDFSAAILASQLKRTVSQVYAKAGGLGLKKSAEFLSSPAAHRLDGLKGAGTRFSKGQTSWNKGTKGTTGTHPNCKATQFKADGSLRGAAQHNYVPIGSLRVTKDGYLERKFTDDPALFPTSRWRPVHREVWEAANGPIPAGHMVVYRPGMRTAVLEEVTLDRLECISRGENARRNHPRNKSPELAKLVQLKGAITRQVNRISREAQEQA